ncbi:MAG: SDR family oxidoreductase [Sedimenticola sp.]
MIYASSSAIYGTSGDIVNYKTVPHPTTYYGISKLRGEEHVKRLRSKLPTYTIRTANVYGYSKSMRFDAKINRYMMDAAAGQRITINGSGNQARAYIHVDDATRVFDGLLTSTITPDTYDLVARNLSIHDITEGVTTVFPETELLFINQHVEPWELQVELDSRLDHLLQHPGHEFLDEITEFKKQFTIGFES